MSALAESPKREMPALLCCTNFPIAVLKKDLAALCDASRVIGSEQLYAWNVLPTGRRVPSGHKWRRVKTGKDDGVTTRLGKADRQQLPL